MSIMLAEEAQCIDSSSIPRRRYFLGAEGAALTRQIAIAGAIGFMLFGYDQGVLGVSALFSFSKLIRE